MHLLQRLPEMSFLTPFHPPSSQCDFGGFEGFMGPILLIFCFRLHFRGNFGHTGLIFS
jgi:hypothetical protein